MMSKNLIFAVLAAFILNFAVIAQDIRINEVVSSNSEYSDEDGDTPDWIELHNFGATPVSLLNWGLTDDDSNLHDWQFPEITLNPDQYLVVWASDKDRNEVAYARTLVNEGDSFKYVVPTSQPSSAWTSLAFDDSSWLNGASGIGFGDGDDTTTISTGVTSVYSRITFDMTNISDLTSLILDVDYDDGFVAYINGVEIARANVTGIPPAYNGGTDTLHEAVMYNGGYPERFLIDNPSSFLIDGQNVLTIEGHNIDVGSSDFTLIPFLTAVFSSASTLGISPPNILGSFGESMHTNFKISSTSEELFLSDENQNIIDQVLVEGLQPNMSYGVSSSTSNLVYYTETTPGEVNSSTDFVGVLGDNITFSNDGGLITTSSINLVLSGNTGNQEIRYTLDATEPTQTSALYTTPISISGTTTVRAGLFETGYVSSNLKSKTYLFNANHDMDVVFLTTEPDNFFDEDTGIYTYGDSFSPNVPYYGANFWQDWERPIHVAFHDKDSNQIEVEFNAGIKVFGGWSRAKDQRSLSIFARGQYGASEIEYPFFDTVDYDTFQSLVLRNSGNDWLRTSIRDASLTSLMQGSGLDFQAFNPVVTYINGDYWGMYNLREKVNEHYLAEKYNLDADEITILQKNSEVIEGSNTEYVELINYVSNTDLSNDTNFEYVEERVDLVNYALYQVAQIYFNNQDWPGNNIKFWKHPEGKWRWILFDTDFGFGLGNDEVIENTLSFALETGNTTWPNPDWSTVLFRNLVENIGFRNQFINRYADELNTRFLPQNVKDHFDNVFAMVASEVTSHYTRWGGDPNNASFNIGRMKSFADDRPAIVKEHIKSQFNIPNYHPLIITNTDVSQGLVEVNNNLNIQESSWTGDYFETVPVTLTAIAEDGYEFLNWIGASTSTDATIELDVNGLTEITPVFVQVLNTQSIVINEINYKSGDVVDADDWVELYNPNDIAVDVSGWIIKDDDDTHEFIFPAGTMIEAEGFLLIIKSEVDFNAAFPAITNYVGEIDFGFGGADSVRLYDSNAVLQDQVDYDDETWAACADGLGPTLELITPDLDNSLGDNWDCSNLFGSPNMVNNLTNEAIVINEINYKSGDAVDTDDWVELYNPNDIAVDVSDWIIKDDDDTHEFIFPLGTMIEADGYLLVIKSEADFNAAFPTITNYVGEIDFGFGGSDSVRLYNADGDLEDQVDYDDATWAACADGLGPTLELITPDLDNSLGENWDCTNLIGSPNLVNNIPLSIDEFTTDDNTFRLYPNPIGHTSTLFIKGKLINTVEIYTVLGEKLLDKSFNNTNAVELNVNNFNSGVYVVVVNNSQINKLIIK